MKLLKQQEGSENENTVYISVKGFRLIKQPLFRIWLKKNNHHLYFLGGEGFGEKIVNFEILLQNMRNQVFYQSTAKLYLTT